LSRVPLIVEIITLDWQDPCPEFQGPAAEEVPMFSPYVGIVPCIGVDFPKMGLPPVRKAVDEKVLLPNVPCKENGVEPTAYYAKVVLDSPLQINYCM
jgi:hypothetical protein